MPRNPYVLRVRPDDMEVNAYLDEDRNDYHISFGQTVDGKHIARATINGHEFIASHANKGRAGVLLTETIDKAEADGVTQHPKTFPALQD